MTKPEALDSMVEKTGLTKRQLGAAYDALFETIQEALVQKDDFTVGKFGIFKVEKRNAKAGRNPRTGEPLEIPEKYVVKFKPYTGLSDAVGKLPTKETKKKKTTSKKKTAKV